jgi:prevent-host-death family protein
MMKTVTATELRTNIYQLLDEVLRSGLPIEVKKGDRKLRIVPVEKVDKFQNLVYRPDAIQGDPEELVTLSWEGEVSLDLP